MFLDVRRERKRFGAEWQEAIPKNIISTTCNLLPPPDPHFCSYIKIVLINRVLQTMYTSIVQF
jgi:hypothetical protein